MLTASFRPVFHLVLWFTIKSTQRTLRSHIRYKSVRSKDVFTYHFHSCLSTASDSVRQLEFPRCSLLDVFSEEKNTRFEKNYTLNNRKFISFA